MGSSGVSSRPGNGSPAGSVVRNTATSSWATTTASARPAAASATARAGIARASRSRRERHSRQAASAASARTGVQISPVAPSTPPIISSGSGWP